MKAPARSTSRWVRECEACLQRRCGVCVCVFWTGPRVETCLKAVLQHLYGVSSARCDPLSILSPARAQGHSAHSSCRARLRLREKAVGVRAVAGQDSLIGRRCFSWEVATITLKRRYTSCTTQRTRGMCSRELCLL